MFGIKQLEQRVCGLENEVDELKDKNAALEVNLAVFEDNISVLYEKIGILYQASSFKSFLNDVKIKSDVDLLKTNIAVNAWRSSGYSETTVQAALLPALSYLREFMREKHAQSVTSNIVDELILDRAKVVSPDTARKTGSTIITLFNAYAENGLHEPLISSIGYSRKYDALYSKDGSNKDLPTLLELHTKETLF